MAGATDEASRNWKASIWQGGGVTTPAIICDRFRLEAEIGRGGMGVVYRAVDCGRRAGISRPAYVALKAPKPELASNNVAIRALEAEARLTQQLRHQNIVTVYDFDRVGEDVVMVMEYLVGYSIHALLRKYPSFIGSSLARRALGDLLAGLDVAHNNGIAHADIKPSNLFICTTGQLKIIDFGIAASPGSCHCELEVARAITPAFASPERLAGQGGSLRDDIYAVGCLVHLLFTGRHPFDRKSALEAQAQGARPALLNNIPVAASTMVNRALAFDPDLRPANAGEMLSVFDL